MISSMFLAKAFSIYLFILSISLFMNAHNFKNTVKDVVSSPALLMLSGVMMVVVGIILVLNHHIWTPNWHGLITLLAWVILIKGIIRMAFPDVAKDWLNKCAQSKNGVQVCAAISLAIAAYLGYHAFIL